MPKHCVSPLSTLENNQIDEVHIKERVDDESIMTEIIFYWRKLGINSISKEVNGFYHQLVPVRYSNVFM